MDRFFHTLFSLRLATVVSIFCVLSASAYAGTPQDIIFPNKPQTTPPPPAATSTNPPQDQPTAPGALLGPKPLPAPVDRVNRIGDAPGIVPSDIDFVAILEKSMLETPLPAPKKIPFKDVNGTDVILKQFKGKVVLLNFWATWCTPCALEMPHLDALQEEAEDTGLKLQVIPISEDFKDVADLQQFYATNNLQYLDIYTDPKNMLFRTFDIVSLPTTILIDQEGQEVLRISGYVEWNRPEVKAFLRSFVVE